MGPFPLKEKLLLRNIDSTHPSAGWGSLVGLIRSLLLSQLAGGRESSVIDGLEDLSVQLLGLRTVEREPHQDERICKALDSNSYWSMAFVGSLSLWGAGGG